MKVLVLGATSAIAQATIKKFLHQGDDVFLVARDPLKLESLVRHLQVQFPNAIIGKESADLLKTDSIIKMAQLAEDAMGAIDHLFIAYGSLPQQEKCEKQLEQMAYEIQVNFLSVCHWLASFANYFEKQGHGQLTVIGSVAGDRGRQSNYIYGSAKGGLEIFCQGLAQRLAKKNIGVLLIKPGFVDTPMTQNIPKNFLFASPEQISGGIIRALKRSKTSVYLPWFWFGIMTIIRNIPVWIFNKVKL